MTTEQLLVCVDLGLTASRLVPYATRFARLLPARLHVVHVVSRIDHCSTVYMPGTSITQLESVLRRRAHGGMAAFRKAWFGGVGGLQTAVLFGDVAQELVRYVEAASITFVIMGTHARAGLNRFMHGSVSDQVARACRVPVMLINIGAAEGIGRLDRSEGVGAMLPQASG